MPETNTVRLRVNGRDVKEATTIGPRMTLADFLRDRLHLTGTHLGCEHGVCGACTIIMDGKTVRSCLVYAIQSEGHDIWTVESLAGSHSDGPLHPIQQAFTESHALQCGFCTPGILMTVVELLAEVASPTENEIRNRLSGNLCRCTGYDNIVTGTLLAAEKMRQKGRSDV